MQGSEGIEQMGGDWTEDKVTAMCLETKKGKAK